MDSKNLIFITGPAGCGKTTNGPKLAEYFGCEIVVDGGTAQEITRQMNLVKSKDGKVLVLCAIPFLEVVHSFFTGALVIDFYEAMRRANLITRPSYWIAEDPQITEARDTAIAVSMGDYGHDLRVLNQIKAEREKQRAKGYDSSHDDRYRHNELPQAAISYALNAALPAAHVQCPFFWPWDAKYFNPEGRRADLIKAAALLVAEIERMDRAVAAKASGKIDPLCDKAPAGYQCTRQPGHDGPCAAIDTNSEGQP